MHNQPFADYLHQSSDQTESIDSSQRRLGVMLLGISVIVLLIGIRVFHVQQVIAEQFIEPWRQETTVSSPLPAANGRILSRDGAVLAYDVTRYELAVDYRWLEHPFDPVWLRRQIYSQLSPTERNDPVARDRIAREIEVQRQKLFTRLARVTGNSVKDLEQRSQRLQTRIEKMVAAVEARRSSELSAHNPLPLNLKQGFAGISATIQSELTTPPRRYSDDPIILKEELQPHVLVEDVPLQVVAAIQSAPNHYRGVHIQSHSTRVYPLDDVAAHLIGLRKPLPETYGTDGKGGIEQQYNDVLAGVQGEQIEHINRRGDIVASEVAQPPRDGKDIILTIDSRLQHTAETLLDEALDSSSSTPRPSGGAVVVLDLWTGDVLAAASAPRFSLSTMMNPSVDEVQSLLDDPRRPFFPRATRMALPPGSVFKIVTAAAALESQVVSQNEIIHCQGYLKSPDRHRCMIFRNFGQGHGDIHVQDALCQSCNVFFYDLSERMGATTLVDWANRFGFGQRTGIDLPGEEEGLLPNPSESKGPNRWYPGSSLQLAIGQGTLLATPIQVARMMAAVGNGGFLVTPTLIRGQDASDAQKLKSITGLSQQTIDTIRVGMEMVVHHPQGTGVGALTPSMTIAAKTGTAEVGGKADHSWFAGFAPVESPRIAFCIVLEHGGSGANAAPIVRQLMTEMIGLGMLKPQWQETSLPISNEPSDSVVEVRTQPQD